MRLLLVEDNLILGEATKTALAADYAIDWVISVADAKLALETNDYDLISLDIGLPDGTGFDVLNWMNEQHITAGILITTAYGDIDDRIKGLDLGADDYIVKPVDKNELKARLRAIYRRKSNNNNQNILIYKDIEIDLKGKIVKKNSIQIPISNKEFLILQILIENTGRFYNRSQIEEKLYGWDDHVEANSVEVHISSLRKKLGKGLIETVRGIGYIIKKES